MSDTIRKGIIDIEPYKNDTSMLMVGNVAALSGIYKFVLINAYISFFEKTSLFIQSENQSIIITSLSA